jgi:putative ABC transport system substrate-binding protein
MLVSSSASDPAFKSYWQPFVNDLRKRGWQEGRNIVFENRFAGATELAAELVALNVDVIATGNTQAAAAAQSKTRTIPIIVIGVADPIGSGLIGSLARPGLRDHAFQPHPLG